jgi:acetoin utilization deacetylase AcuC-like enzyme
LISSRKGSDLSHKDKLLHLKRRLASDRSCAHSSTLVHPKHTGNGWQAYTQLDPDTVASAVSYEVARYAVGSILTLIDATFAGEISNGFAFVRPPGHHAEPDRAMGFCLFSNAAIGAAYALQKYKRPKCWWLT